MPPIGWGYALMIWGYALVWFVMNSAVKHAVVRMTDPRSALACKALWARLTARLHG